MELKRKLRKAAKRFFGITAMLVAGFISLSAAAATVTYPQSFSTGWNLVGNSLTTAINVKTTFGSQTNIQTIWKWDAVNAKWAFYSPALDATAGALASYATTKGYSVLTTINQGEGYWVNASAQVSLAQASGTGFALAASNLVTGWNLAATGDDITPASFTSTVGNVTTQWAWDSANSAWYFYAPSMAANALASYISSKNYKDFGLQTLGNGRGFWVNYAGAAAGGGAGGTTPTIGGLTPSSGAVGVTVTISGTNFSATPANNAVSFNGVAASVTSATTTQLVVTVPATATSGNITVLVGGQTATSASGFTVTAAGTGTNATFVGTWKMMAYKVNAAATVTDMSPYNMILVLAANGDWTFTQPSTVGTCQQSGTSTSTATTFTFTTVSDPCSATSTAGKIEASTYTIAGTTLTSDNGIATYTYQNQAAAQVASCATIASCRAGGTIFSEPTGVAATAASSTQINLNWTAVTGATGYNIYRDTKTDVAISVGNKITATPVTATSYNDTASLIASKAYYYKVTTVMGVGESSQGSAEVSATTRVPAGAPAAPTNIGATAGASKITFSSWTAVTGALSYNLYYSTTSPVTKASTVVQGIPKPYVLNVLLNTVPHYYALTAVNAAGESALSTQGTVTPTGAVPMPEGPISASVTPSVNQLTFAWPSVPTATSYKLYYGIPPNSYTVPNYTVVSGVTSPYVLTGLLGTTSYGYKITAVNAAGESLGTAGNAQTTSAPTGGGIAVAGLMGGAKQGTSLALANTVSTYAGGGAGAATAIGTAASFYFPKGVTTDGANLYVVENGNATIRKVVIATGEASIFFKGGQGVTVGANGSTTCCSGMWDITTDGTNLYIVDKSAYTVSQVNLATKAWTFLGSYYGTLGGSTDGTGTAARFFNPTGITTDGTNLYVTDAVNRKIRQIVIATGVVTTLAGGGPNVLDAYGNLVPVDGTGANASFTTNIAGITTDGTHLYVADYTYIRKITIATGEVTTISLGNYSARGITTDGVNLYVGVRSGNGILKVVIATGEVTNLAGFTGSGLINGAGASARFSDIFGLTTDGTSLYIIDAGVIRKIE